MRHVYVLGEGCSGLVSFVRPQQLSTSVLKNRDAVSMESDSEASSILTNSVFVGQPSAPLRATRFEEVDLLTLMWQNLLHSALMMC